MHPTLICFLYSTASIFLVKDHLANVDAAASFSRSTNRRTSESPVRAQKKGFVPHNNFESAFSGSKFPESEDKLLPSTSIVTHSRRDFLSQQRASAMMLSSLILGSGSASAAAELLSDLSEVSSKILPKTIVITGANSGIGLEACQLLAQQGHTLVLACRSLDKAQRAAEAIQHQGEAPLTSNPIGRLIPAECDLSSLSSIQSFASGLKDLLGPGTIPIDTLCLNAGVSRNTEAKDCARTKDGFELTGLSLIDASA
jgi:short chain dehydrogenase